MSNQHVQAVENALSGERTHHTISFPATGDEELDYMNGLLAIVNRFEKQSVTNYADPRLKRVLRWFFSRTEHLHELPLVEKQYVPMPQQPEPMPMQPVYPWSTTSGGAGQSQVNQSPLTPYGNALAQGKTLAEIFMAEAKSDFLKQSKEAMMNDVFGDKP